MCGWCSRVWAGGAWVEVEAAAGRLGLFERPLLPSMSHGICEDCYARVTETVAGR